MDIDKQSCLSLCAAVSLLAPATSATAKLLESAIACHSHNVVYAMVFAPIQHPVAAEPAVGTEDDLDLFDEKARSLLTPEQFDWLVRG